MSETRHESYDDYRSKGFAVRSGYGNHPALLVVDFINGFTDPATPLGGDFASELAVTQRLLEAFRAANLPVVYTTVAYNSDFSDAGVFIKKVPSLSILVRGSRMCEIDDRIPAQYTDHIVEKQYASAFFGTDTDAYLKARGVDTVVITGCTTSGCIRASAIDSMQYGYLTVVVRDAVGDRAQGPHDANLFDIDAKYADVVPSLEVLDYVRSVVATGGLSARAQDDFQRWWSNGSSRVA